MVSGLGLSPFRARDVKPASKDSILSAKKAGDDTIPSNGSSEVSQKTLEKKVESVKKPDSKKTDASEKTEFKDKLSATSSEEKSEEAPSLDGKKPLVAANKNVKTDSKKQTAMNAAGESQIAVIQKLDVPTQIPVPKVETDGQLEAISEKPTAVDIQKLPAQARPVAKFLQSMKEYFGISPEKVVRALNQLPADVLMKSPHEAMTPLFEKLELQPRDFTKAQIYFTEMVSDIEKTDKGLPIDVGGKMMAPMAAATPAAVPGAKSVATPKKSTLDALIEQKISRKAVEPQNYMGKQPAQTSQESNQADAVAPSLSQIFHIDPMTANQAQQQAAAGAVAVEKLDPQARIQDIKVAPGQEQIVVDGDGAAALQFKNMIKGAASEKEKNNLKDEGKTKLGDESQVLGQQDLKQDNQFSKELTAKTDGPQNGQPNSLSKENVNMLSSQTQTLITKGGGEMKVQLRPEGMGDVLLKVKVQDGQVGIQMTTDNHDAKRLLESGLNDLKMNLAEHKLSLNHINVDVSNDSLNNSLNNQNRDAQREQARDFLGQFRENNESLRQQFAGLDGVKAYGRGSPRAPDLGGVSNTSSTRNQASDGRLHLVA